MVKRATNSTNKGKKPLKDGQEEEVSTQQELKDRLNAMQQQLDQACQRVNDELHTDGMACNSGAVDVRRQSIEIEETEEQLEDRLDQMNVDIARMTKQLNELKRKRETPTSKASKSQAKKNQRKGEVQIMVTQAALNPALQTLIAHLQAQARRLTQTIPPTRDKPTSSFQTPKDQ